MARKKAKQGSLAGMEPPTIPALDDAAENYYDTMMERQRLSGEEAEAKDNLIDKMKENGLDRYVLPDGKTVMVTATANVKVKPPKKAGEDNGDDHEEE